MLIFSIVSLDPLGKPFSELVLVVIDLVVISTFVPCSVLVKVVQLIRDVIGLAVLLMADRSLCFEQTLPSKHSCF